MSATDTITMDQIPKRQKLVEEIDAIQCEDMISNLPNILIAHILSFLPMKEAVATSALSTKWKLYWTLITILDFEDRLFEYHEEYRSALQISFTNFVHSVLRGVSCIDKFRIKCGRDYDGSHVKAWADAALHSGVKEFDLSIPVEDPKFTFPWDLFRNRTLVVLKLGFRFPLNLPLSVSLPALKTLHLNCVLLNDGGSINKLLSGCPVLEELSMRECIRAHTKVVHIGAPFLKRLSLTELVYGQWSPDNWADLYIVLDTPALQYLKVDDNVANYYSMCNLDHIIRADVRFENPAEDVFGSDDYIDYNSSLLSGIRNVRSLYLNGYAMQFHNLTMLELAEGSCSGLESLTKLLNNSPLLETLILGKAYCDEDDNIGDVPSCLQYHTKIIEIRSFEGRKEEKKLVNYFINNGAVLEKLVTRERGGVKKYKNHLHQR